MSHLALARKYRPRTFADVVGQEAVVRTLVNALRADRVAQGYLLAGPRGVGKTTLARILSMALNCPRRADADPCGTCPSCARAAEGNDIDVLEVDGASHNGIDAVREICANVLTLPASGRYRIYIIDEVHMLSGPAFNALLKTLEEPPPHVKFIFATTHPHKVIPTILSRCQRFDLRRIPPEAIAARLADVCRRETIAATEEALLEIARRADGGLRDALSLLEQAWALAVPGPVEPSHVREMLGLADAREIDALIDASVAGEADAVLARVDALWWVGTDLEHYARQVIDRIRARLTDPGTPCRAALVAVGESLLAAWPRLGPGRVGRAAFEWALLANASAAARARAVAPAAPRGAIGQAASPPSDAPAPPAAPEGRPADLASLWGEVLVRVKRKNRATAAFLAEAAPRSFRDGAVEIVFAAQNRFHKESVEQVSHRVLIEECLREVFGPEVRLRATLADGGDPGADPPRAPHDPPVADPLLRKAADIFQGRLVAPRKEARE